MPATRTHRAIGLPAALGLAFVLIAGALPISSPLSHAQANVRYVNHLATGAGTGDSWADAATNLRDALAAAQPGQEFWVAAGTYLPGPNREDTFALVDGVAVYGGFAGTEVARAQRDPAVHVTTLSGELGVVGDPNDNSYHVVSAGAVGPNTVLDGMVISGGNAEPTFPNTSGGGMSIIDGSPRLRNVIFQNNHASGGGGLAAVHGAPYLENVSFVGNTATNGGGAVLSTNSRLTIVGGQMVGNQADQGGAVYNAVGDADLTLVQVAISGNRANDGAALMTDNSPLTLRNVTIGGNHSYNNSPPVYNYYGALTVVNSVLWGEHDAAIKTYGGLTRLSFSLVRGGGAGPGVLNADPRFLDPLGADGVAGTLDDDLRVTAISPVIDAGNTADIPNEIVADAGGQPRFVDVPEVSDTGVGTGALLDMGAYEFQPSPPPSPLRDLLVNNDGPGQVTLSWTGGEGAVAVVLERAQGTATSWSERQRLNGGNSQTSERDLRCGETYWYRLWASTALGGATVSAPLAVTVVNCALATPTGLSATAETNTTIVLRWADSHAGAASYRIERTRDTNDGWQHRGSTGVGATSFNDQADCGITYSYRIRAVTSSDQSLPSDPVRATISDCALLAPTNLLVEDRTATSVALAWNDPNANSTHYVVERSENSGQTWLSLTTGKYPKTRFVDATVRCGPTYQYRVRAVNAAGSSAPSEVITVDVCPPDAAPSDLAVRTVGRSDVQLFWTDTSSNEDGYRVEASADGLTAWNVRGEVAANATSFTDAPLLCGSQRHYRVVAFRAGQQASSASVLVRLPDCAPVFVDVNATGAGTGRSWADAYSDLRLAIAEAATGSAREIWVAQGTYLPEPQADSEPRFMLRNGVAIYGGFAGTETRLEQRDWVANPTVLSGDLGVQGEQSDNLANVVASVNNDASAILDGFVIRAGRADSSKDRCCGGGMSVSKGSPTLANLTFYDNHAVGGTLASGGALFVSDGKPALTNVRFLGNSASWGGGALYVDGSTSVVSVVNAVFAGNHASSNGGAVYIWGGTTELFNTTVISNTARYGGAIRAGLGGVRFRNSIAWGNTAVVEGSQFLTDYGAVVVISSIVQGGFDGTAVSTAEPRLINPNGVDSVIGTLDDDPRLAADSPGIDMGNNAFVPARNTADLNGASRRVDVAAVVDSGVGEAPLVDLGAYEYQPVPSQRPPLLTVASGEPGVLIATWSDLSEDEDGFVIEHASGSGPDSWVELARVSANTTTYRDSGRSCAVLITYRVRTYRAGVYVGPASNQASGTPVACPAPAPPLGVSATASKPNQIQLNWTIAGDTTSVQIEQLNPASGQWTPIRVVGAATTTFTNSGLPCATLFSYRLRAIGPGGTSGPSDVVVATTMLCPPRVPQGLRATTVSRTQVDLVWQPVAHTTERLTLERQSGGSGWTTIATLPLDATSFTDRNVLACDRPSYRLLVTNRGGSTSSAPVAGQPCVPTRLYVNQAVASEGDGSSWSNAFGSLREALRLAIAGDTIWVAAGTYTPGSARSDTFRLLNNLALYGGFAGTETRLEQRDWVANPTLLSGDIGVAGQANDNSYRIVTSRNTGSTTLLDGFSVVDGRSNSYTADNPTFGAGMLIEQSTMQVRNVVFARNVSATSGGAATIIGGSPQLINVAFLQNSANDFGSALSLSEITRPTIVNAVFQGNQAHHGGGTVLVANMADPTFVNTTFVGNNAPRGAALYTSGGANMRVVMRNSVIWGNTGGGSILNMFGASLDVSYSIVEGGYPGIANRADDPMLAGDLRPLAGSPAIDAGRGDALPAEITTDLAGLTRRLDDAATADAPRTLRPPIDIGAYEYAGSPVTVTPTASPSATSTAEPTATLPASPTASPTATDLPTASPTITPTVSATIGTATPSATVGTTATPTHTPVAAPPEMQADQTWGRPGSTFRIAGQGYTKAATLTVLVDQQVVATVQSDATGAFALFVRTASEARPGSYTFSVTRAEVAANAWPSTTLVLDPEAPLHAVALAPGDVEIHIGGQQQTVYLPFLQHRRPHAE